MTDVQPLQRTPLFDAHVAAGGQMVPFAGWEMPVQYKGHGLVSEHLATRQNCGLFDVSHMGEIIVQGPGACDELNRLVTNDVAALEDGEATYALLTHADGGTVDDLFIYRLGADRYLVVVNAANTDKDFAHMLAHAGKPELFSNRSGDFAQIAVQGPRAIDVLRAVIDGDATELPRNKIRVHDFHGANVLVATTGYTGELGYELYAPPEIAAALWGELFASGAGFGIVPCGLGARDTLRLESGYALYGHELADDINGYEARVGWAIKLKRGDFVGRDALAAIRKNKSKRRLVGLEMVDRGIPRAGYAVKQAGEVVGHVTSGTHSPSLAKPIALALVPRALSKLGTSLELDIRGRIKRVAVCKFPFYTRTPSGESAD